MRIRQGTVEQRRQQRSLPVFAVWVCPDCESSLTRLSLSTLSDGRALELNRSARQTGSVTTAVRMLAYFGACRIFAFRLA
jgi:hypothetical protein